MQDEIYRPEWHLIKLNLNPLRKQLRKEKLIFNAEAANVIYDAAAHVGIDLLNAPVTYVSMSQVVFVLHNRISAPYRAGKMEWSKEMLVSRVCSMFSGIIHKSIAPDDAPAFCFDYDDVQGASIHVASNWIQQSQNNANHCARQDFELKTGVACSPQQFEKIPEIFRRGICIQKCPETFEPQSVISTEPCKFAMSHMLKTARQYSEYKKKRKVTA
jgi:hypothetical protein